jgi:hypothetical protein
LGGTPSGVEQIVWEIARSSTFERRNPGGVTSELGRGLWNDARSLLTNTNLSI